MPEKAERSRDFERLVPFVDAIVITLLVLPLVELEDGSVTPADLLGVLVAKSGSQAATKVLCIGTRALSSVLIAGMAGPSAQPQQPGHRREADPRPGRGHRLHVPARAGRLAGGPGHRLLPAAAAQVPGPAIKLWRRRRSSGPAVGSRVGE